MFDFNDRQERALDLTQHVVLTAAAGSGKTSVLVERFVRLLETTNFQPRKIVALTFTEEAAREMRERVARAVAERAQAFGHLPDNPWTEVSGRLSQASITTIHGFCLQIINPNFSLLGLDPETRVLSPAEQPVLLDETILASLNRAAQQRDPDLALLLDSLSIHTIASCLKELVGRRNAFREIVSDERAYAVLEDLYRQEACHWIQQSSEWRKLCEVLQTLPAMLLRAPGTMSQRCQDQLSWISQRDGLSDYELVSGMAGTLTRRFSPSRLWKESDWSETVKQAWSGLRSVLAKHPLHFDPIEAYQEALFQDAVGALTRFYERVLEDYSQAKQALGAIDFEGLLGLARSLLESDEMCLQMQRRYPILLVDEFQDTNQIQWEILRALLGPNSNFMAVGDDKQSIYRFRQADVSVFREVRKWVARVGKTVEMPENYRSGHRLVDFNNQVFAKLFKGNLDYEAVHQEMVAAGSEEIPGGVESFFSEPEDPIAEHVRVASWIEHLMKEGRVPSEIAILLRTRNRLKLYEEALSSRDIPFVTVAGAGFFESQEVLDSICLLRWLADPDSEIALAGVLRSSFFSLSDECLLELSKQPGETLTEKLMSGAARPDEVAFACRVLSRLRSRASEGRYPSQLLRTALRETGYEQILASSSQSQIKLGNLRKLSRLFCEFEEQRSPSLRSLLRFLDGVLASGGNEPESNASLDGKEGVRIYTIHGAKGLEFPVVILPDLGYPFSAAPNDQLYLFTEHPDHRGRALAGLLLCNPRDYYREYEHPHYRVLQKLDSYRQLAEEKRLLYVAMTRSREHLILIGRRGAADSYAGWLLECGAEEHQVAHPFVLAPEGCEDLVQLDFSQPDEQSFAGDEPIKTTLQRPNRPRTVWSPTQVSSYLSCPRRFYLSEVEGVPEEAELSLTPTWSEEAVVGTVVHEVLERMPGLSEPNRIQEAVSKILRRLLPAQEMDIEGIENRICGHLDRVSRHPVFDRLRHADGSVSEREFHWQVGACRVQGVIDRLIEEGQGNWVVVDFKTSGDPAPWDRSATNSRNQDQLAIYLAAMHRILKPAKLSGLLLFTATGHVERIDWQPNLQARTEELIRALPLNESPDRYPKTPFLQRCQCCPHLTNGHCDGAAVVQQTLW